MKRVLLVSNRQDDAQYSMLGFGEILSKELPSRGWEPTRLAPQTRLAYLGRPHTGIGKWLAYVDKYVLFPRELKKVVDKYDLIHILDQGNAMYASCIREKPHLITLHDLLATRAALGELPMWRLSATGKKYQMLILSGLNQIGYAACASEATMEDAGRILRPETKLYLIKNGFYYPCSPMNAEAAGSVLAGRGWSDSARYLLHVGGNQPTKNRIAALPIYAEMRAQGLDPNIHFIFAGKAFTESLSVKRSKLGLQSVVHEWPDATREELCALYSRAEALVYPSYHEGFGLPIIEAQACGCPVFTTGKPPMNEVGGEAGCYFDPDDPVKAASIILGHWDQRHAMRDAGYINAAKYATEPMVDSYAMLYEHIVGESNV